MAKISSITIGKGTGSIGNVTLANVGGVTVAKQKIASNKSNTGLQAVQRGEFKRVMNMLRALSYFSRLVFSREGTRSAWARFAKSWYAAGHRMAVSPTDLAKGLHFLPAAAAVAVAEDDPSYNPVLQDGSTSAVTVQYLHPEGTRAAYLLIRGSAADLTVDPNKDFPCEVTIVESLYQVPARYASANADIEFGPLPLPDFFPEQHTVYIDSLGGFTYVVPLGESAAVETAQKVRDSGWPLISIGGVRPRLLFKDWWSIAS